MDDDYDVLVIGAGLGGISTAALLSAHGFRTLVLEQADTVGGCCSSFRHGGYLFDTGATMVMLTLPLEEIFRRMGKNMKDYIELIPCDPIYCVHAFDGRRFALPRDIDEAAAVVASIAPEDVEGWRKYVKVGMSMLELLGEMMLTPANTMSETLRLYRRNPALLRHLPYILRTAQGVTLRWLHNPVLQSAVAFQAYCAGSPPDLGMGSLVFVALCEHLGIYYPRGGMIAIPEGIRRVGEEYGLEVRFNSKVEAILLEGRKARGVVLEDGTVVTSRIVVSNVNAKLTYLKMVGPENLPAWAKRAIGSYEMAMPCPMVYVGLDTRPPLDAHHTICTGHIDNFNKVWNEYYVRGIRPKGGGWLISWPTESDPGLAPEGCHTLNFVWGGPAPYALLGDNWDRLKPSFIEEALGVLEKEVMRDISDHIKVVEVSTPLDFERRLLSPQGAIYGLFLDFLSSAMFRPHPRSRVIENLYLAGASTGLGGGVPTTLASGVIASDYVLRDHA
ncbi:MAG: NAD(P)/FAD-dependent oxidoreductase [Actinobacteria bacterium]|nr:NAD(P)/FAD-dependent oxidoreductase [Actinomycetota bacterium]